MALSFQTLYTDAQNLTEDTDTTTTLPFLKRAINQGAKKFGAILNREWRRSEKTFSTVADQQYYQTPEDCIRVKSLTLTIGGVSYPVELIDDEEVWRELNKTTVTSDIPEYFFIRGNDEFGIYPIPATSTANAGTLKFERKMRDMSAADYTTGTITVTNDSATVTGSGTTFTAQMVGRSLKVDDPNGDGMWYKIAAYTSATSITLENTYSGSTAGSLSFAIGELPDIPEEFHEALVDYALYRYYTLRRDLYQAREAKKMYDEALMECKASYSSVVTSQYMRGNRKNSPYGLGRYKHEFRDFQAS